MGSLPEETPRAGDFLLDRKRQQTGTLIIGVLSVIGSVIGAIFGIMALIGSSLITSGAYQYNGQGDHRAYAAAGTMAIIVSVIMLIIYILYIAIASMLIHGARTEKPGLMLPWLILTGIYIVSIVFRVLQAFIFGKTWLLGITYLVIGAVTFYLFLAVYSFRKQLQEGPIAPKV